MKYTNLKFYSEFSLTKGIIKSKKLIKLSKKLFKSLCLMDHNTISGAIDFFENSKKYKIKPILGCEIKTKNKFLNRKITGNLSIIVKNKNGYKQLCKLIKKKEKNLKKIIKNKDIIILSGGFNGIYTKIINNYKLIYYLTKKIKQKNKNFYIEIQRFNKNSIKETKKLIKLSKETNTKLVATHPIRFIKKKDFEIFKARNCILEKKNIYEKTYMKKYKNNFLINFKKNFKDIKESITNANKIANKCKFKFNKKIKTNIFNKKKREKFKKELKIIFKKFNKNKIKKKKKILKYKKRFKKELKIINDMNYIDYFIIVKELTKWANKNNILYGPGRGSCASSLISYILKITKIDPIKYKLYFERFLNINKKSMPDFDIDFCKKKRKQIIKHLKKKYGNSKVTKIITFGKFSIRNSIKDSGRIIGINYKYVNKISEKINKIIKNKNNKKITNIKEIIKIKTFKKKYIKNKNFRKLINIAIKIDGYIRNYGIHAGGIIITKKKYINYFPSIKIKKENVSQFNKISSEKLGFIKIDILGLNTLTVISDILKKSKANINFNKINTKNKKVFELIRKGNNICIFQLENDNLNYYIKKIKPNCFNDIINIISLYRPGPINLINEYCKNNYENKFLNKKSINILKETRGIIIFQEQLIKLLKINTKYNINEADLLRTKLLKNNKKEINKIKKEFYKKCKNKTKYKKELFNIIKEFSGYSFNKAHAVSYAYITFIMAWLKSYFKCKFFISNLNFFYRNRKKLENIYSNCFNNKIYISKPNINKNKTNFEYINKKKIEFGMISIKSIGKKAIKHIIKIRKRKRFENLIDFCKRTKRKIINKKNIIILIYCGFFEKIEGCRKNTIKKFKKIVKNEFITKKEFKNQKTFKYINILKKEEKNKENTIKNIKIEKKYLGFIIKNMKNLKIKKNFKNKGIQIGFKKFNKKYYKLKIEKEYIKKQFYLINKKKIIKKKELLLFNYKNKKYKNKYLNIITKIKYIKNE
ncbi:MAG: DNA polymerase III subunit alpha [Candidatus Vidania fulgoroideorum]